MSNWWSLGGGFLLGSVGLKALKSKAVRKNYKYVVAGAMIARDYVMEEAEKFQAAASNVAAEAKEITERYYAKLDEEYADDIEEAE